MVAPRKESRSASAFAIGPVRRFGPYTLVKKLATGGMAEIWLARQRGLAGFNRFVVIKKILAHLAEQKTFRDMFLDEARTCAVLSHPNIVQVYDLGKVEESYFIAMEFIAGENLAAIAWRGMKRSKPFPPYYAARVIADGCKALHYAHHLKGTDGQPLLIVHRDISPQNVLVTYEGEIKVVDFGIAKAASKSEQTKTGMLKGKFSYMSPEQCLGSSVDMRSDIFALGILLYELCTGKRLFKHESELMILEMITKRSVVAPSQVAPAISAGLEDIIMKALEKDPRRRYQNAQEMQFALEEYLRDEGHQATNADIASYMRSLFSDKIEEKRRLREIASREDFEAVYAQDDPIQQASQRISLSSGMPGDGRMGTAAGSMVPGESTADPRFPHGIAGPYGPTSPYPVHQGQQGPSTPTGYPQGYPQGSYPQGSYPYSSPEMLPPDNGGWVAPLVIAGALVVIMVASFILFQQVNAVADPSVARTANPPAIPSGPLKTGNLTLKSSPSGAVIYLDGEPMKVGQNELARTPSDLSQLECHQPYHLRLVKEGYEPFETKVVLTKDGETKRLMPTLKPLPGRLIAEVQGTNAEDVRVYFDGEDVGLGPRINRERPGHQRARIRAELAGHVCQAEPSEPLVRPEQTIYAKITCKKPEPVSKPSRPRNRSRIQRPRSTPSASKQSCRTFKDQPTGRVTISTTPHAEIFWKGRKLGESPLSNITLPSGCVVLKAKHEDSGLAKTFKVTVVPNMVRVYKEVSLK